jgi:hypothetical protein
VLKTSEAKQSFATTLDLLHKSKNVQILDLKHIQKNVGSSFSLWDEEVTPQEDEGF